MVLKKTNVLMVAAVALLCACVLLLAGCSGNAPKKEQAPAAPVAAKQADAPQYKLQTKGKLTIATSPDFPPFENLVDGKYVGFDIEIGKAIAKKLNLEPEFVNLQFDAILPAIASGTKADLGISGFTSNPERAKQVDFSQSYYTDDLAIGVMKSSPITKDTAKDALNKKDVKIAVQSGTSGETYVKEHFPQATLVPYGNSNDCFAAMNSGQVTAVCTNSAVVEKMLSDAYKDAKIVSKIATGEEYAVAVSKSNPELTKAVNEALKSMKADGTTETLLKKYL